MWFFCSLELESLGNWGSSKPNGCCGVWGWAGAEWCKFFVSLTCAFGLIRRLSYSFSLCLLCSWIGVAWLSVLSTFFSSVWLARIEVGCVCLIQGRAVVDEITAKRRHYGSHCFCMKRNMCWCCYFSWTYYTRWVNVFCFDKVFCSFFVRRI